MEVDPYSQPLPLGTTEGREIGEAFEAEAAYLAAMAPEELEGVKLADETTKKVDWERLETFRAQESSKVRWVPLNKDDHGRQVGCRIKDTAERAISIAQLERIIEHTRGRLEGERWFGFRWDRRLHTSSFLRAGLML